jgi:aryl-alcohol dehydrogenase-like predicted oxidoreductase
MRYRALGRSGLLVSVVGLGCNNFGGRLGADGSHQVVKAALDAGITLFDTADIYGGEDGSESILGEALAGHRDQVVIATKFGHAERDMGFGPAAGAKASRGYIARAVEASLRRLRTDYIDLYQLHTPDPVTPIEETLSALDDLVRAGKVRYLGNSQFAGWQIAEAAMVARSEHLTPFVSAQDHWSLLERRIEAEAVPAARRFGLGVLPFFPLANGMLTGKVRRGQELPAGSRIAARRELVTPARLDQIEELVSWAESRGHTLLDVAIAALAEQPGCASVIAGAMTPEQVTTNAAAADWIPTADELSEIDAIVPPPPHGQ